MSSLKCILHGNILIFYDWSLCQNINDMPLNIPQFSRELRFKQRLERWMNQLPSDLLGEVNDFVDIMLKEKNASGGIEE